MNNVIAFRKKPKNKRLTRILLLISFLILLMRLLWVIPAAFEHHKQKKAPDAVSENQTDTSPNLQRNNALMRQN